MAEILFGFFELIFHFFVDSLFDNKKKENKKPSFLNVIKTFLKYFLLLVFLLMAVFLLVVAYSFFK